MKILYLQRHAKSSWGDPSLTDRQRPLNSRGMRDAPRMGLRLAKRKSIPDLIVSSPAVRALTTARIIAEQLTMDASEVVIEDAIYGAGIGQLIQIIQDLPDEHAGVMLTGHNPYLTYLVNDLSGSQISNIPTCGLAIIQFNCTSWLDVKKGDGKLLEFDYPKKPDAIDILGSKIDC